MLKTLIALRKPAGLRIALVLMAISMLGLAANTTVYAAGEKDR